ncbi:FliI/YscN family ATPase (plasmid) [Sphingomonas paeninsulae]|uniref:Flagellum-specific ATP synthase n=1 Tax=Sphingomonas paeninsulae TaxID=2319844 RepID=A0A494T8I3_SPHPE|nr:FliI/YscN family ATPase [Sphingomonas paeninsulae]AYJ85230.1 FliI/YscN family ATPase [Sphingomonas paeninsulae]
MRTQVDFFTRVDTLLSTVSITTASPKLFGTIAHSANGMLRARGLELAVGSGARIATENGRWEPAIVAGFGDDGLHLVPFAGDIAVTIGARVTGDETVGEIDVGRALLGRVIDAMGLPLDGLGPVNAQAHRRKQTSANPMNKARIDTVMTTGVRAIDGLMTLGQGQRLAIIAGSGVGKSTLLAQIMRGVTADAIIVALVGERAREIADFVDRHVASEARARTTVVAAAADVPAMLRLRAVERATALAEQFRDEGKRVLLIVDSLTRLAHAQREIGLAMGEPPTVKGYPPSSLAMIPRLVERSGGDKRSGGSITALYTILADGDDLDDPVVDTARSITDGHIVLSRSLAEAGVFPAIDLARSLSRSMNDLVDEPHRVAAAQIRRDWSLAEENRDLVLMGAYRQGADPEIDRAIAIRPAILDFIRQDPDGYVAPARTLSDLQDLLQS